MKKYKYVRVPIRTRKRTYKPRTSSGGYGLFSASDIGSTQGFGSAGTFDFGTPKKVGKSQGLPGLSLNLWDTRPAKVRFAEKAKAMRSRLEEKQYAIKLRELEREEKQMKDAEWNERVGNVKRGFGKVTSFFKKR